MIKLSSAFIFFILIISPFASFAEPSRVLSCKVDYLTKVNIRVSRDLLLMDIDDPQYQKSYFFGRGKTFSDLFSAFGVSFSRFFENGTNSETKELQVHVNEDGKGVLLEDTGEIWYLYHCDFSSPKD